MKVIYIAGKYRGPNAWAIEQNIRAAEEVAARVWQAGMVALCPHANARHMLEGFVSDEAALAGTLELLRRCDAVVLVPNWRDSAGARAEVEEADRLGKRVFGRLYVADFTPDDRCVVPASHIIDLTIADLAAWHELVKGNT